MPAIAFASDPAGITLGEGLSVSARYWRATIDLWSLPVAVVATVTALVAWLIGIFAPLPPVLPTGYAPGTDPMTVIGPYLPGLLASTFVTGAVSMVAGWVYLSIAVAGLRGYRVMPGWIVRRGIRAFAAEILLALGFGATFAILGIVSLGGGPALAIVVMVTALIPAVYLSLRLIFWSLAIFDGAGIGQGLGATWLLSRGAVARMLGWGLAVGAIGVLVNLLASIVTLPLGDANPVRAGITAAVTEALAAWSTIAMAVIYESQRRRSVLRSPWPDWSPPAPVAADPADSSDPADPSRGADPADPSRGPDPLDPPAPPRP